MAQLQRKPCMICNDVRTSLLHCLQPALLSTSKDKFPRVFFCYQKKQRKKSEQVGHYQHVREDWLLDASPTLSQWTLAYQ